MKQIRNIMLVILAVFFFSSKPMRGQFPVDILLEGALPKYFGEFADYDGAFLTNWKMSNVSIGVRLHGSGFFEQFNIGEYDTKYKWGTKFVMELKYDKSFIKFDTRDDRDLANELSIENDSQIMSQRMAMIFVYSPINYFPVLNKVDPYQLCVKMGFGYLWYHAKANGGRTYIKDNNPCFILGTAFSYNFNKAISCFLNTEVNFVMSDKFEGVEVSNSRNDAYMTVGIGFSYRIPYTNFGD